MSAKVLAGTKRSMEASPTGHDSINGHLNDNDTSTAPKKKAAKLFNADSPEQAKKAAMLDLHRLLHAMETNEKPANESWQGLLMRANMAQSLLRDIAELATDEIKSRVDRNCKRALEIAHAMEDAESGDGPNIVDQIFRPAVVQQNITSTVATTTTTTTRVVNKSNAAARLSTPPASSHDGKHKTASTPSVIDTPAATAKGKQHVDKPAKQPDAKTIEELQASQREQIQDAIHDMAAQLKQETSQLHSTLQQQTTGVLEDMEQVTTDNVQKVGAVAQDVKKHNVSSWKRGLATWTTFFALVGVFLFTLVTIQMAPKSSSSISSLFSRPKANIERYLSKAHDKRAGGIASKDSQESAAADTANDDSEANINDAHSNDIAKEDETDETTEEYETEDTDGGVESTEEEDEDGDEYAEDDETEEDVDNEDEYAEEDETLEDDGDEDEAVEEEYDDNDTDTDTDNVGSTSDSGETEDNIEEVDDNADAIDSDEEAQGTNSQEAEEQQAADNIANSDKDRLTKPDPEQEAAIFKHAIPPSAVAAQKAQPKSGITENGIPIYNGRPFTSRDVRKAAVSSSMNALKDMLDVKPMWVDAVDKNGWGPLHLAIRARNREVVQLLLDYKANRFLATTDGRLPATLAEEYLGPDDEVTLMLRKQKPTGETVDAVPKLKNGRPVIKQLVWRAAMMADYAGMEELLDIMPEWVNEQDNNGWNALHMAARTGSVDMVSMLIKRQADKTISTRDGRLAVDIALQQLGPDHDVVRLLQ